MFFDEARVPVETIPVANLEVEGPAPVGVIESSRADVSFIVGLLLDKFAWHLPLYRQHQRLEDAGILGSRAWLTQLGAQGCALLDRIYAPKEVPLGGTSSVACATAQALASGNDGSTDCLRRA